MTDIPGLRGGLADLMVVFDGQSLNNTPAWEGGIFGHSYAYWLLHDPDQFDLGRPPGGIAHAVPALGGTSWTTLATTVATRTYPLAAAATTTVLAMCGGTADINGGDTGAQVYADMVAYADGCRTAGFDLIVACTITPSTTFDGTEESRRVTANGLIIADADDAFDAVADMAAPPLDDPTDGDYYFDGTHLYAEGTVIAAQTVGAVLWPLL